MSPLWTFCCVAAFIWSVSCHQGHNHHKEKTLILLVDGVRWDYISRDTGLKGFPRMEKEGSRAEYVSPIFPSNSYPNWYSIVTGLYAESHGFVQNYMYDVEKMDTFTMAPNENASHEHWWNKTEPLWITAEKRGIKTAMYWWDGCQVVIDGVQPSVCKEYQSYWTWTDAVKADTKEALSNVLTWFETSHDNRLAFVYYEGVDAVGHFRGPNTEYVKEELREIDGIIDKFQDELEARKLKHKVNFLVVSDHGMADSDPKRITIINLEDHNVTQDIELMLDRGSLSMILPVEGREDKLYRKLKVANIKGVHIYKKDEIPERYHLKGGDLVLPILLVADEGFFIQRISNLSKMRPPYSKIFKGYHGYDPYKTESMRTIFYATGPSIKKGFVSPPITMVDHYNLFCHLLETEALPNNGSWEKVQGFFEEPSQKTAAAASITDGSDNGANTILNTPLFWICQVAALLMTVTSHRLLS